MDYRLLMAGLFSALIVGGLAAFSESIARVLGVVAHNDGERRLHIRSTPLTGGPCIFTVFILSTIWIYENHSGDFQTPLVCVGLISVAFFVGFIDDRNELSANARILIWVLVLVIAEIAVPVLRFESLRFASFELDVQLQGFVLLFTTLALAGVVYVVNLSDGINGLVLGLSSVWLAVLLWFSNEYWVEFYIAALLGGVVVLFLFNIYGKLFLGDSGSYFIGSSVSIFSVILYSDESLRSSQISYDQLFVWIFVPMLDGIRVTFSRILRRGSPFKGDRSHLHHYLSNVIGAPCAMVSIVSIVAAASVISVFWPQLSALVVVLLFVLYLCFMVYYRSKHG